jgi:putative FmdB family regulatory protein
MLALLAGSIHQEIRSYMPIYEYQCAKCGAHIEVIQKVGDPPPKRCSKCKGKLEKRISRTSFQLKGSGWYKTDYSSGSSAGTKEKSESSSDKKSEPPKKTSTADAD